MRRYAQQGKLSFRNILDTYQLRTFQQNKSISEKYYSALQCIVTVKGECKSETQVMPEIKKRGSCKKMLIIYGVEIEILGIFSRTYFRSRFNGKTEFSSSIHTL